MRCRVAAEQRFTEQVITSAYESIYQELAERRAAA
jgi:hypothetical protein